MPRVTTACGLVTALIVLGLALPASAGWWDDLDRGQTAELSDVIVRPSQYQGRILTIFCIYHRKDTVFAPMAAPYVPDRHENIAVWVDGAPLWDKKAYENDYPFLYIDRANPQHAALVGLEPFTRIEITCRIRGAIRARPCLEIRSFRLTGHRLGRTVVQSVIAGDRHAEASQLELSYENYRRALQPDLPPKYDLLIRKRVAESLRRLGRIDEAMALEGSRILGGGEVPEGRPRPEGGYLGDPLPGTPGAPGTFPEPSAPAPGPAPISRDPDDLPGTPAGDAPPSAPAPTTSPISRDLPGTPAAGPPPIIAPDEQPPAPAVPKEAPRQPPGEAAPPVPPVPAPVPPAPSGVPSGAPPRLPPRLSGVK